MPFTKGTKKPENSGAKKGMKYQKTIEWEQFGRDILESGLPRAKQIMAECKDSQFMIYFTNLLEYFKPKLNRTTVVDETPQKEINISLKLDRDLSE